MPTEPVEIPVFGRIEDPADLPDRTDKPFRIAGYDQENAEVVFDFAAKATVPVGVLLDLAGSAGADGNMPVSAIMDFFEAVLIDEDVDRFLETIHMPEIYFVDSMLQGMAEYLSELYSDRPTAPRSARRAGRGSTGRTSMAARRSLVSDSRTSR